MEQIVENWTDEEFEEFQLKLTKRKKPLYIRGIDKDVISSLSKEKALITIIAHSNDRDTLYSSSNRIQCNSGCRRSLGDIFNLMRYYFPEVTLKEVRTALHSFVNKGWIGTLFCGDINKRVYFPSIDIQLEKLPKDMNKLKSYSGNIDIWGTETPDEFNKTLKVKGNTINSYFDEDGDDY